MENITTSSQDWPQFVRSCFEELLSDGEVHSSSELLEYARNKAQRENLEGEITSQHIGRAIHWMIHPQGPYLKKGNRCYQLATPEVLREAEKDPTYGSTKADFIRFRFAELLSDGKRYSSKQIENHIIQCALGTQYEGEITPVKIYQAIRGLQGYQRVHDGVYQKCTDPATCVKALRAPQTSRSRKSIDLPTSTPSSLPHYAPSEELLLQLKQVILGLEQCITGVKLCLSHLLADTKNNDLNSVQTSDIACSHNDT